MSRRSRPRIPLRHRLKNPPSVFVGRGGEIAELVHVVERGTVAIVCGPGGLGKTALVSEMLQRTFPTLREATLMVSLRPDDPNATALDLIQAITSARGLSNPPTKALLEDADALIATAIDLADEASLWLVIDDFHHAEPAFGARLLESVGAYARSSKWLVTTRRDPKLPTLTEQTVRLGPMSKADLVDLATRCAPELDELTVEDLAERAAGSPWRLRQSLTRGPVGAASDALDPSARQLLAALLVVDIVVPAAVLEAADALPDAETVTALEERGFIELRPAGIRLHDVARASLSDVAPLASSARSRLCRALVSTQTAPLIAAAIGVALRGNDEPFARNMLEQNAERLLREGETPRLWQFLEDRTEPWALPFRLRCATEIGSGAPLQWAKSLPAPDAPPLQLLWIRSLMDGGELERAHEAASQLAAMPDVEPSTRDAARLLAAQSALTRTLADIAEEHLGAIESTNADVLARRDVLFARIRVRRGEYAEAVQIADRLGVVAHELDPEAARDVHEQRAVIYRNAGYFGVAREANLAAGKHLSQAASVRSVRSLLRLAGDHIEQGELAEGRKILERITPTIMSSPHLLGLFGIIRLRLSMASGDFRRARTDLADLLRDAERARDVEFFLWAIIGYLYFVTELATPIEGFRWPEDMPLPSGPQDPYIAVYFRMYLLRARDEPAAEGAVAELAARAKAYVAPEDYPELVDVRFMAHQCVAVEAALRDDAAVASQSAARAVELAESHSWLMFGADARKLECLVLIALGRFADAEPKVAAFRETTAPFDCERFRIEADLLEGLTGPVGIHPSSLERIAAQADCAPAAARIAHALLGGSAMPDRLERVLLASVLDAKRAPIVVTLRPGASDRAGWGVSLATREAWFGDGRTIDLSSRSTTLRILSALVAHGGAIDKATLASAVWNVRNYHPIQDDGRIHVAIRRARTELEVDASKPTRLITTAHGYEIGTEEPFRYVAAVAPR